jgi:hypothetical protein
VASGGSPRIVESAAQLAFFGLDPFKFLNCRDPVERMIFIEMAKYLQKMHEVRDHNLAVEIANQVGRLFKK